jgi:hypothetical protein
MFTLNICRSAGRWRGRTILTGFVPGRPPLNSECTIYSTAFGPLPSDDEVIPDLVVRRQPLQAVRKALFETQERCFDEKAAECCRP